MPTEAAHRRPKAKMPVTLAPKAVAPSIDPVWSAVHSLHYEQLANQQNMLEDSIRTSAYHQAITHNPTDFKDRVVLDVGAGSGILSLFAAQAGARHVYAVEGTEMAGFARTLCEKNGYADRITVIESPFDKVDLKEKVDVIVSEPLGILLVHERMLEVFLAARQRWLKPGGKMYPSRGRMWLAPFRDEYLWGTRTEKTTFWADKNFYGVDLGGLAATARDEMLAMPVCGPVDESILMGSPDACAVDFCSATPEDLALIHFDFTLVAAHHGAVHGLAAWFDVSFDGSDEIVPLTTAPGAPGTHWHQLRLMFAQPIEMSVGQALWGRLTMTANAQSSYTLTLSAELESKGKLETQTYALHRHIYWWHNGVS